MFTTVLGQTIKSIQGNTGTKINTPKVGGPQIVTIVGTQAGVTQATKEIGRLINPEERKQPSKHASGGDEDEEYDEDNNNYTSTDNYEYNEDNEQKAPSTTNAWNNETSAAQNEDSLW